MLLARKKKRDGSPNEKSKKSVPRPRSVLNDLSFSVGKGEVVGLLGPNGAGKTTAFYLTIGLINPDSGSVLFAEEDVTKLPMHKRARMGMGYLAQEPSIFRGLTVEQNILCVLETIEPSRKKEKSASKNFSMSFISSPTQKRWQAPSLVEKGGGLRSPAPLSPSPTLLLLDEPFANIDPITVAEVKALIPTSQIKRH